MFSSKFLFNSLRKFSFLNVLPKQISCCLFCFQIWLICCSIILYKNCWCFIIIKKKIASLFFFYLSADTEAAKIELNLVLGGQKGNCKNYITKIPFKYLSTVFSFFWTQTTVPHPASLLLEKKEKSTKQLLFFNCPILYAFFCVEWKNKSNFCFNFYLLFNSVNFSFYFIY